MQSLDAKFQSLYVRFGSKADITAPLIDVCFTPKSGKVGTQSRDGSRGDLVLCPGPKILILPKLKIAPLARH